MAALSHNVLPTNVRNACERLAQELEKALGENLIAMWLHGAATFDDRPKRLGDVDTHGVLANRPDRETAGLIEEIHESNGRQFGVEWDSWYILEREARGSRPPRHALLDNPPDHAWALHRAHWLAGQYVLLSGCAPSEIVQSPSWEDLKDSLRSELSYIEGLVEDGRDDPQHAAFAVWNASRIIYSARNHDVVISKRAAALWALGNLPAEWHPALRAAGRVYDGTPEAGDAPVLRAFMSTVVTRARDQVHWI
jgi:hypothetical protein